MSEPSWLDDPTIIEMHAEQLEIYGGPAGIRDGDCWKALAPGRSIDGLTAKRDVAALAASYAYGLARNHPFIDGNKRIAFFAMVTFLLVNGRAVRR